MNKLEYITALRSALAGMPPEVINDMISAYEMRFIEGASLGRSEAEIIQNLDTPEMVANRLRNHTHFASATAPANGGNPVPPAPGAPTFARPGSFARLLFSFVGLGVFNLFMIIPAIVFCSLLFASYVSSVAFMVAGSGITAASMADVNQITLDHKAIRHHHLNIDDGEDGRIDISDEGIQISSEHGHGGNLHIGFDGEQRRPSAVKGITLIVSGILLFLLNLVITKYSFIGLRRYAIMNYTILKNA